MSNQNHAQQQIRKLAIELYEQAIAAGTEVDLAELGDRLIAELAQRFTSEDRSIIAELIEISARDAIKSVDSERTKPVEQPTLMDDLDRPIPIGKALRRIRRRMNAENWAKHMAYVNENAAKVNAAAGKENHRYASLLPYLAQGMDTEASLTAWQADHPEKVLL